MGILLKYIVYYVIQENFVIYKNKQNVMNTRISIDMIYNEFKENKFYKMMELSSMFQNEVEKKLLMMYKK